jgi:predicted  nucleic acid-binding Zn-ribbon protein
MHSLRSENETLRQHVAALETEKILLKNKISAACERLETLRDRLPEA